MEKRENNPKSTPKDRNYELKSDAVEELVSDEVTQYPEEELAKYRRKKGIELPELAKILLLKAWFAGAVCYFILWGLGMYLSSTIDMLFVVGIVLGMVTDLLTNNVLRFIEKTPGANDKWLLVTKKGIVGFFANLMCALVIVICVFFVYDGINRIGSAVSQDPQKVILGVEPVLYGIFCMGFDMLLIGIKHLCQSIFRDAAAKARRESGES